MADGIINVDVLDVYLNGLEKANVTPNFWCSREYLHKSGKALTFGAEGHNMYVREDQWCVFPPVCMYTKAAIWTMPPPTLGVWSDFPGWAGYAAKWMTKKILDYEYLFNPSHFQNMAGGTWATFRKNCRKWPRDNPNSIYIPTPRAFSPREASADGVNELLCDWLETLNPEEAVQDDEVMLKYASAGEHRKFLFREDGKLMGVNIWDYNWKYINFRYSICRPDPYLAEYMRWLFYTDPAIANDTRLVNDGGSLDREGLRQFKLRMNPVAVREVYSWEWKTEYQQTPYRRTVNEDQEK